MPDSAAPAQCRVPPRRTEALTVLSPIRPPWTWLARLVLDVLPRTPWGAGTELQELRFIQSARWALVTSLPGAPGQPARRPRYDYMLFESNFNGTLDSYLEAFADILRTKMRLIWTTSYGFPNLPVDEGLPVIRRFGRPIPAKAFIDYVRRASLPAQHFWSAYPGASTTEVLAGLAAEAAVADLRGRVIRGEDATAFARAFDRALLHLQSRPEVAPQPESPIADVRGGLYAFTALSPIRPGAEPALRETLAALEQDAQSPFTTVPGVHFARWVVIDDLAHQPGQQRDGWPRAYLMTSTTADGAAPPYRDLHRHLGPARDAVYSHCEGYPHDPDEAAFAAYLEHCRLPTGRFYAGYPFASVGTVVSSLDTHRRLVHLTRTHATDSPADRLEAFRAAFCPEISRPTTDSRQGGTV